MWGWSLESRAKDEYEPTCPVESTVSIDHVVPA